jgi:hypothetical protein
VRAILTLRGREKGECPGVETTGTLTRWSLSGSRDAESLVSLEHDGFNERVHITGVVGRGERVNQHGALGLVIIPR